MNEHKTPEQIAGDAMRDHKGDDVSTGEWWSGPAEEMHQVIVAAINADRAQRSEPGAQVYNGDTRDVIYYALRDAGEGRSTSSDLSRKILAALRAANNVQEES